MRSLGLVCLVCGVVSLGMAQSAVSLSAPASTVVCGGQLAVSVTVQGPSGNVVSNATVNWRTSDQTIATVDPTGMVTGILPGIVTISAFSGGVSGSLQLQIVPSQIAVTPANQVLHIGDSVQYSAAVLDINQQPLPVNVTWQLAGANGYNTSEARLSATGLLTTYASTNLTIRAMVLYPGAPSDFVNSFIGTTTATVLPPMDYSVQQLVTTNDTRQSFRLLARRGGIAVNDSEQLATVAALDGLSDGVLLAANGGYQVLASGGTATLSPGGNLIDFEDPIINNSGNVVVRADSLGNNSGGLLLLSQGQFQYLLADGTTSGYTDFENTNVSHYSLNDNGVVVFRASYLLSPSSPRATGLFDTQNGLDVSSPGTPVPGLQATFNFDQDFGMDSQGALYFGASDGVNHGVFRLGPDGTIAKAVMSGDPLGGSTVRNIFRLGIDFAGDLAVGCDRADGYQFLLRYPGGNVSAAPDVLPLNGFGQIYTVNAGGVLFLGDGGQGWGLYIWPPKSSTANPVLLQSAPTPGGDLILEIQSAAMTSAGVVFAKVRTAIQPLEMLRIAPSSTTLLFQSGDQLPVTANLTLRGLVPGAATGDANPLMGGFQSSIFQFTDSAGLVPRVLLGDRLSAAPYYGNTAVKAPDGTLYVSADDGIYRVGTAGNNVVVGLPHLDPDGVIEWGPRILAANESGAVVWFSDTSQSHARVTVASGGSIQILAYIGNNPQFRTASPAGGFFSNCQDLAIDSSGRIMARFTVSGGPSGYFLWANGQWTATALFGQTKIPDQVVDGANELKAAGTNFYATFTQHGPTTVLAQYAGGGNWTPLFAAPQALPSGAALQSFRNFTVNRNGDIAFSAFADGGFPEIVVLTGGTARLVYTGDQPLPDGTFLYSIAQIDFRDDRRVFFVAFDFQDRLNLYAAKPLF